MEWVKDARENVEQLGFQGREAVTYLCGFLERPALTRVRNSRVNTAEDRFVCLEKGFGAKWSYIELETQFRSPKKVCGNLLML